MLSKESKKRTSRVQAVIRFTRSIVIFGFVYPLVFLVTLYFYLSYINDVGIFDNAVRQGNKDLARSLIPHVINSYLQYNLALFLMNLLLLLSVLYVLFRLIHIQKAFNWYKSVRTTKIIIGLLLSLGSLSYIFLLLVSYLSVNTIRDYLYEYINNTSAEIPHNFLVDYSHGFYMLAYFLLGVAFFYALMSAVKIMENFDVLERFVHKLRLFEYVVFVYFIEPYIPIKLTWFLFPLMAILVRRELMRILRRS